MLGILVTPTPPPRFQTSLPYSSIVTAQSTFGLLRVSIDTTLFTDYQRVLLYMEHAPIVRNSQHIH